MKYNPICTNPTKAAKRYVRRIGAVGVIYIATVWVITKYVHEAHPTGAKLLVLAATPALDVIAMIVVVGMYLREEVDEFKRYQLVVAILAAVGVTLAMLAVTDFLRSYGAMGEMPPFATFVVFWMVLAVAQSVQSIRNRVKSDD